MKSRLLSIMLLGVLGALASLLVAATSKPAPRTRATVPPPAPVIRAAPPRTAPKSRVAPKPQTRPRPRPKAQKVPDAKPLPLAKGMRAPMVIAHRGASGRLPEHTMAAYQLALRLGADAIEPDLVATKDGILIIRHENELSGTTDVAKRFPKRKRKKKIDGRWVTGWFSEDFTLAEIRTIRAIQRLKFRSNAHDGKYPIVTFREFLSYVQKVNKTRKHPLVIVPELKHPTYFISIGVPLEPRLLKLLREFKLDRADAPVIVQSFEVSNLKWLHKRTKVRLLQLLGAPFMQPFDMVGEKARMTYAHMMTDKGLKQVATYAYGIGPWKGLIWSPPKRRMMIKPNPRLILDAHRHGLRVVAYTFRNEPKYLAKRYKGDPIQEYHHFFRMGLDAVFTDFPATALRARRLFHRKPTRKPTSTPRARPTPIRK